MEYEFYYADLKTTLTLKADKTSIIGTLTDQQYFALQQVLYLALNMYQFTMAMLLTDSGLRGGDTNDN